jgi:transposase InsO family protein
MVRMPWMESTQMDQRIQFIATVKAGHVSFAEACRRSGISRKTGYKWAERYEAIGVTGLQEQSRAPKHSPQRIEEATAERLLKAKREHPKWGALKLIQFLERKGHKVPAVSTANDLLKRHGLVNRRPQHGQLKSRGTELGPFDAPNAIWCADYKGQFQLGNRSWCYPLTVTDGFSRFFLLCQGMPAIVLEPTKASFERLFRERGLPDAIRTDNGMPFGSSGAAGLSRLSVWWLKLGIRIERIVPGRPQQNGRHERVHRTLQEHTGDEPENDLPTQQIRFDRFLCEFNFERPHQALDGKTPSDLYRPACREFPRVLETPAYPGHHALRRIRHDGSFHWQGSNLFLGDAFSGETVGFEEFDDDRWLIRYAGVELAVLDGRGNKPKVHRLPIQRTVLGTVQGKLAALAPSAPWTAPARRG